MGRPRKRSLPRGVHERVYASGRKAYFVSFAFEGRTEREYGGASIDEAARRLAQRRRQIAEGTYRRGGEHASGEQALSTYAAGAFELRAGRGVRTVARERQLFRDHIEPHLGRSRLADLTPQHVERWIDALTREGKLSPKSILNAHGVLGALLSRARFDGLVISNPARDLPRGTLPENVRRREVSAWTRAEVLELCTREEIPEDRRIAYAIAAFTGARLGEVAGLRWRDLDVGSPGLWRWALRTQYDGAELKTERPRDVPIHLELQRTLAAWKLEGWSRLVGRHPRAADFVVPREDGSVHSDASLGAKAVHRHARLVGVDATGRDFHSFRRFMITTARTDGARELFLERVTHNARGSMLDRYTYAEWPELCAAVSCLRLELRRGAPVVRIGRAVASGEGEGPPAFATTREGGRELPPELPPLSETGAFSAENEWRRRESNPRPRVLY